eukprot:10689436-Lingulodinium_polyedra.AAC.1
MVVTCSSGKRSTSASAAASTKAESLIFAVPARGLPPTGGDNGSVAGASMGRRKAARARVCNARRRLRCTRVSGAS